MQLNVLQKDDPRQGLYKLEFEGSLGIQECANTKIF